MSEAVITLDHVSASERDQTLVEDISFTVHRGEAVALVGSNASGKGLVLRLCAGLEAPASGGAYAKSPPWLFRCRVRRVAESSELSAGRRRPTE